MIDFIYRLANWLIENREAILWIIAIIGLGPVITYGAKMFRR